MPLVYNHEVSGNGRILVWRVEETENEILTRLSTKSPIIQQIMAIKADNVRLEKLIAQLLIKEAFPFEITYYTNSLGAPKVEPPLKQISISHSYPYVALYLADTPCGVDIELPKETVLRIRQKFLSLKELQNINGLRDSTIAWASKEVGFKIYEKGGVQYNEHMNVTLKGEVVNLQFIKPDCSFNVDLSCKVIENAILVFGHLN